MNTAYGFNDLMLYVTQREVTFSNSGKLSCSFECLTKTLTTTCV